MDSAGRMAFGVPEIVNQTPQIFAGFNLDGSPVPQMLPGPTFADHGDVGSADDNDPKRRRIARACDMCRKKKIKCDGREPRCSNCINYKTECVFTRVEKKRSPPKGAKYIEGLENRLGRMEALLKLSGLLSDEDGGKTDLETLEKKVAERASQGGSWPNSLKTSKKAESYYNTPQIQIQDLHSSPGSSLASPTGSDRENEEEEEDKEKGREGEVEALSDMMCSLVTNNCGESRYIGSSSGFSIFSPKGIQWVSEKTGDSSFQEMITTCTVDDNKWIYWKPDIFSDLFMRRVFKPLPPKDEAMSLLKDFFGNFNCMFPLFHEPTFFHLVDRQYSSQPYEGSGWWASINVALAISHRLRVMSNLVPAEEDQKAWLYLKNAMGVLTELTMRNTDLLSVQALLGMSMFLQGTPNPQPTFFLVAAAVRLSHSIGLHKRGSAFNLNPIEAEQRKRVFWIGYLLDKDICLRSGRPPAQDDDDMNVELPSEDPPDNIGNIPLADGMGKINLFRLMCTFASISSKVYKRLYAVSAARQSDGELLNTIGELDKELEEWKDGIPIDFRPEHEIKASHTPLILHIVVLHFAYYNCLTTIHRMSIHHGYWTSRLSDYAIKGLNARPLNPRVFSSASLCVSAARASIQLIKYIPQGDFACVWLILYFPVSALVTLFANILQNPQDSRARADVELMNLVVIFLSKLVSDEENGSIKRMLGICAEFERIANVVLDKTEQSQSRRKRKPAVDDASANKLGQPAPAQPSSTSPRQSQNMSTPSATFTPGMSGISDPLSSPSMRNVSPYSPPQMTTVPTMMHGHDSYLDPTVSDAIGLGSAENFGNVPSAINAGAFQQPFVPQDLWQMPMTLEWDWADLTKNEFTSHVPAADGFDDVLAPP